MVSLLKTWYGDAATKENEFAFDFMPKPAANSSWISIYDQALKGKMEGVILSGMTATSIGPDSNQVMQALANLKWLVVMDPLPTTSSEFWRRPGVDPEDDPDRGVHAPDHALDREGRLVRQQRPLGAVEGAGACRPRARPATTTGSWPRSSQRVKKLYQQQGGKFPDPIMALTLDVQGPDQARAGRDRPGDQRLRPDHRASGWPRFGELKDDGTTTAGDWIYTGSYPEAGNLTKRRAGIQDPEKNDPTGMGFYHGWAGAGRSTGASCTTAPRRTSTASRGTRRGPASSGTPRRRSGPATCPTTRATMEPRSPKAWGPFIMNGEGVGRLFSATRCSTGRSPSTTSRSSRRSRTRCTRSSRSRRSRSCTTRRPAATNRFGTVKDYPYVATSYRLTEHEHYVTQHVPHLVGLQPEAVRRGARGAGATRRASRPATGSACRPSAASSRSRPSSPSGWAR